MQTLLPKIKIILKLMGLDQVEITLDEEHRRVSLLIDDDFIRENIPAYLSSFNHIINLILKKENLPPVLVDINYYRKERERLVVKLAKAAAYKANLTKSPVELPPMNSYERRLIHLEITVHPELETESLGEGKERRVVIRQLSS